MTGQPLCPDLWTSITIDHRGNVYSCCLNGPACYGSIIESNLRDLINCEAARACRRANLEGSLDCIGKCTWIQESCSADSECVPYESLRHLNIAFGEPCNINCIMCKQRARGDNRTLDYDLLVRNVDVEPFTGFYLTGGEPLYIRNCRRYMDFLSEHGKKYGFSTNGMLLDREFVDTHIDDLDFVTVSVNAATKRTHEAVNRGSDFDRVMANVRYLADKKRETGSDVRLIGRMTITVNALQEIPEFIEGYSEMGFDCINFGFDKGTVPAFLSENPEFFGELRERVYGAYGHCDRASVDAHRLRILGLL